MSTDTTWHDRADTDTPYDTCMHCWEGSHGHYVCTEQNPCQDCTDDALTASENIAAGYGAHGEDTGADDEHEFYTYIFPMGDE